MFAPAVLFIIGNNPTQTLAAYTTLRLAEPKRIYLVANGPAQNPGAPEACQAARLVVEQIDWNCEVKIRAHQRKLQRTPLLLDALRWFFQQEIEGIVLEDCFAPSQSFYLLTQRALPAFRDQEQVFQISGVSPVGRALDLGASAYFSKFSLPWCFASWRRSWEAFNNSCENLSDLYTPSLLDSFAEDTVEKNFWANLCRHAKSQSVDSWEFIWALTAVRQQQLSMLPTRNLVTLPGSAGPSEFPLVDVKLRALLGEELHDLTLPEALIVNVAADQLLFDYLFRDTALEKAALIEAGVAALNSGDAARALELFEHALALYPRTPTVCFGHAVALIRSNRTAEALVALEELVENYPDFANAREALEELNAAREVEQITVAEPEVLASGLEILEALAVGEEMSQETESDRESQLQQQLDEILSALERDDLKLAENLLAQARSESLPVRDLEHTYAVFLLRTGDRHGAIEALRREVSLFPDNLEALLLLEDIDTAKPAGSITSPPEQAEKDRSDEANGLIDRAIEALATENGPQALKQAQAALDLAPKLREVNHVYALALIKVGREAEARPYLERELQLYPDNTLVEDLLKQY